MYQPAEIAHINDDIGDNEIPEAFFLGKENDKNDSNRNSNDKDNWLIGRWCEKEKVCDGTSSEDHAFVEGRMSNKQVCAFGKCCSKIINNHCNSHLYGVSKIALEAALSEALVKKSVS